MNHSLPFYSLANLQRFVVVALVLLCAASLQAQTPKVAFVGVTRTGSPDGFSFVAGESLPASSTIYFTDEEYREVCGAFHFDSECEIIDDGEPYILYTAPNDGVAAGEVVTISETTANTFTVGGAGGTAVLGGSGSFTLSASDCLFSFATSNPADPLDNVTEIYAGLLLEEAFDGSVSIGDDPRGDYPNAIVTILNASDGEYTPGLRNSPADAAAIMNVANWTIVNPPANLALSPTPFTGGIDLSPVNMAVCPTLGSVTTSPSGSICEGTTFDVTITGLANMASSSNNDTDYGIRFVAFSASTSNPYVGGIDLATVAFGNLTASNTMGMATGQSIATPGTYTIYAVLSPTPEDADCRPSTQTMITINANPAVSFTALADVCIDAGIQAGLGGAAPTGGVYSGSGVTDDGNGMTYSFDPATAGVGVHTITYNVVDANGCAGSATDQVEVFAVPTVTFTSSLSTVGVSDGTQTVSGGSPMGGTYSGSGVTDDGNGMSFTFDPATAGVGTTTVTYSFTDANGCSNSATADIEVTNIVLPGDVCGDAIDISSLFGGPINTPQVSDVQDNTDYNPDNDPGAGYECWFGDPVLNNTIWYAFTGDGEKYTITTLLCDTLNSPLVNNDSQFALYSGDCTSPVAVACNDDEDFDNQIYNAFLEITTEVGVDYLLMVDGYVDNVNYAAIGTYCLEVTKLETVGVQDIRNTEFNVYPNPTTGWVQLDGFTADQIEVLDQLGRTVRTQAQAGKGVDLSGLPAGVYVLRMTSGTDVYSAKVVKE